MLQCAYCNSEVENDSWFCDQCGKEILLCETCHLPGRNQWCEEDGGALVAARSQSGNTDAVSVTTDGLPARPDIPADSNTNAADVTTPAVATRSDNAAPPPLAPKLKLVNGNLGITLDIQAGSILGRTTGPYTASLGALSAISGKHLSFKYDIQQGWSVADMGSSNGTKYSKTNNAWQQMSKLAPNMPITLEDKAYLLIANVEFSVQIENASPTSTQRI